VVAAPPTLKKSASSTAEAVNSTLPAMFVTETAPITPLPGDGPVLLDIDMDFFCNFFDDSSSQPGNVPGTREVVEQIHRLEEFLSEALAGRQVELVTIALSPGFYPSILWEETFPLVQEISRSFLRRSPL
jgi:hypothetical protein